MNQHDIIEALRGLEAARVAIEARGVGTDTIDATELQLLKAYAEQKGPTKEKPQPESQPIEDPCVHAQDLPLWLRILLGCI